MATLEMPKDKPVAPSAFGPAEKAQLDRFEKYIASGKRPNQVGQELYFKLKQMRDTPPANPAFEVNQTNAPVAGKSAGAEVFDPAAAANLAKALPVAGAVAAPMAAGPLGLPVSGALGTMTAGALAGLGGASGRTLERGLTGQDLATKDAAKDIAVTGALSAAGEVGGQALGAGIKAGVKTGAKYGGRVLDYLAGYMPGTTKAMAGAGKSVVADTLDSAGVRAFAEDVQGLLAKNHADIGAKMESKAARFDLKGKGKVSVGDLNHEIGTLSEKLKIGKPGLRVVDEATENEMKSIINEIKAEIGDKTDLTLKDLLAIRRRLDQSLTEFSKGGAGVGADTKAFNPLRNWVDGRIKVKYPTWKPLDEEYVQLIGDQDLVTKMFGIKPGVAIDDAALVGIEQKMQRLLKAGDIDKQLVKALENRLKTAGLLERGQALGAASQLGKETSGGITRAATSTIARPVAKVAAGAARAVNKVAENIPAPAAANTFRVATQTKAKSLADSLSEKRRKSSGPQK